MDPYPVKILYEDESYIIFDKPAGLLVIPSPKREQRTLVQLVNGAPQGGRGRRLYPCHRLDRDTSGVIIFAKGKKNQRAMMREFQKQAVAKRYIAFVRGKLRRPRGEMRGAIRDFHQRRFAPTGPARRALTRYRVTAARRGYSVVEVFPETGRTNQIRIHFSQIGHPLLGERLYAFGRDFPLKFRRLALHASEVTFRHPVHKRRVRALSPLPGDMLGFLKAQQ